MQCRDYRRGGVGHLLVLTRGGERAAGSGKGADIRARGALLQHVRSSLPRPANSILTIFPAVHVLHALSRLCRSESVRLSTAQDTASIQKYEPLIIPMPCKLLLFQTQEVFNEAGVQLRQFSPVRTLICHEFFISNKCSHPADLLILTSDSSRWLKILMFKTTMRPKRGHTVILPAAEFCCIRKRIDVHVF